jgi:hypothetical protein
VKLLAVGEEIELVMAHMGTPWSVDKAYPFDGAVLQMAVPPSDPQDPMLDPSLDSEGEEEASLEEEEEAPPPNAKGGKKDNKKDNKKVNKKDNKKQQGRESDDDEEEGSGVRYSENPRLTYNRPPAP